jgi:hypothetical protein
MLFFIPSRGAADRHTVGQRTDPLAPTAGDVADSVLVLHRALPDLQRMKLWYSAAASSASRSVFSWCD